jgi:acetylornithine aminotransferase
LERYDQRLWPVFKPSLVLAGGSGAVVWDVDGREYLDLLGGIAVNAIGHAHPVWVEAVSRQAATLGHVSNLYASAPQIELAGRLLEITGAGPGGRVFFTNSGTEANEAALKAVLRRPAPSGRGHRLAALEGSFHGRTLGALALTAKAAYREPFREFTGEVDFLPFGDLGALEAALRRGGLDALVIEVIQGEAGARPLPPGYLAEARRLTARHGALLWIDEIQTGIGRTGAWTAYLNPDLGGPLTGAPRQVRRVALAELARQADVGARAPRAGGAPDLVTLAKGLGGGFPIGAVVAMNGEVAARLGPGDHGTTFGGGPLAAAAALATLQVIEDEGLMARAAALGAAWREALARVPGVQSARGGGLLIGLVLARANAPAVVQAAQAAGFLINATGPDVIRLAPPLILTTEQAERFAAALPRIIQEAA